MKPSQLWKHMRSPRLIKHAFLITVLCYSAGIQSDSLPKPVKHIEDKGPVPYESFLDSFIMHHPVDTNGFVYNPYMIDIKTAPEDITSLLYFLNPMPPTELIFDDYITTNLVNVHNSEIANYDGGLARGILLNPEGYFLTNHHVISITGENGSYYANPHNIRVILRDGTTRHARILCTDFENDLALGRVDLGNYTVDRINLYPNSEGVNKGKDVYIAAFGWFKDNELESIPNGNGILMNFVYPGTVTGRLDTIKMKNENFKFSINQKMTNCFASVGLSGSPVFDSNQMLYGLVSSICAPDRYMILTNGKQYLVKKFLSIESTNIIPPESIRDFV